MNIILQNKKLHTKFTPKLLKEWDEISSYYKDSKLNKKENLIIGPTTANRIRLCLRNPDKVEPLIKSGEITMYDYQGMISYWNQYKYFDLPKDNLTKTLNKTIGMFKDKCDEYEEKITYLANKIKTGRYEYEDEKNFLDQMDIFYIFYHYYYLYVLLSKIR